MNKCLDKFPKYNAVLSQFDRKNSQNCEGYTDGEEFFEIADEYKTDENWELDIPRADVFISTSECLPFQ
jgi:hypothetical protein